MPDVAKNIMLKTVGDCGDASLMDFLIESAKQELWRETQSARKQATPLAVQDVYFAKDGGGQHEIDAMAEDIAACDYKETIVLSSARN